MLTAANQGRGERLLHLERKIAEGDSQRHTVVGVLVLCLHGALGLKLRQS